MRLGDPNGPIAANTVRVGELIFHRWECQDNRIFLFFIYKKGF
jgi:hypothetical protein